MRVREGSVVGIIKSRSWQLKSTDQTVKWRKWKHCVLQYSRGSCTVQYTPTNPWTHWQMLLEKETPLPEHSSALEPSSLPVHWPQCQTDISCMEISVLFSPRLHVNVLGEFSKSFAEYFLKKFIYNVPELLLTQMLWSLTTLCKLNNIQSDFSMPQEPRKMT